VGLFFDDFELQRRFTSRGRTVTEADVVSFAALSGDYSELHTNEEYARQTPYGRRIAHGALVLSMSIGLTTRMNLTDDTILALWGIDDLRFLHPVFIGDTIQIVKRVIERRELDAARGLVVFETRVTRQDATTVVIYHDKLLMKRRSAGEQPGPVIPSDG
jgi:3-hydroxybutyryl-CoA dehydratase